MATTRTNTKTAAAPAKLTIAQRVESTFDDAHAEYLAAQEKLLNKLGVGDDAITFTRWVSSHLSAIAVGVGMTTLLTTGLDLAVAAVITLTGSAFASMMVWVVGVIVSIYAVIKSYGYVYDYVATKKVDVHYGLAKLWVGHKGAQIGALVGRTPKVA